MTAKNREIEKTLSEEEFNSVKERDITGTGDAQFLVVKKYNDGTNRVIFLPKLKNSQGDFIINNNA